MANLIAVCIVADDGIKFATANSFHQFLSDFWCTHFGHLVVGTNIWRRDQQALFAGVEGLSPTAKEEGDMGVLLGLGNAQLLFIIGSQILAQGVNQIFRWIGAGHLDVSFVLCGHNKGRELRHHSALKTAKVGIN